MNLKKELRKLEQLGVFIHTSYEHYSDGTNCNFSIEFTKQGKQTGWYGDNGEFGDSVDCLETAIRFANWLLEEDHLELYFANPTETVSEEGHKRWMQLRAFRELSDKLIYEEFNNAFNRNKKDYSKLSHMIFPEGIRSLFSKETYKLLTPVLSVLEWSIKLWLLTIVIPITFTIIWTIIVGILGYDAPYEYLEGLSKFWSGYYVTGKLFDITAWKWHLAILFVCFLASLSTRD